MLVLSQDANPRDRSQMRHAQRPHVRGRMSCFHARRHRRLDHPGPAGTRLPLPRRQAKQTRGSDSRERREARRPEIDRSALRAAERSEAHFALACYRGAIDRRFVRETGDGEIGHRMPKPRIQAAVPKYSQALLYASCAASFSPHAGYSILQHRAYNTHIPCVVSLEFGQQATDTGHVDTLTRGVAAVHHTVSLRQRLIGDSKLIVSKEKWKGKKMTRNTVFELRIGLHSHIYISL